MYAEMGAPIRDAFVLVHSGSGKGDVPAALDEQGRFRLPITAGFYDVEERRATPLCGRRTINCFSECGLFVRSTHEGSKDRGPHAASLLMPK